MAKELFLYQTVKVRINGGDTDSSSVSSRLEDIHEAFADPKINAILTTIGGYNSIHLLKSQNMYLLWVSYYRKRRRTNAIGVKYGSSILTSLL
jgi:muramoyltetrapeptide carboxypeptidase LdcA involved in peptidoglycan recycling